MADQTLEPPIEAENDNTGAANGTTRTHIVKFQQKIYRKWIFCVKKKEEVLLTDLT